MKRQVRPFGVEIKQKRGQRKHSSIWGGVNLSAAMAESDAQFGGTGRASAHLVDTNDALANGEPIEETQAEPLMDDPQEPQSAEPVTPPAVVTATRNPSKRAPRKAKTASAPTARKSVDVPSKAGAAAAKPSRKIYSQKERAQKLAQIEKSLRNGDALKSAIKQAQISEQTYYVWKRSVLSSSKPASSAQPDGDGLKDLVALEEENKRLKRMLADQLRKENAELKKRLGQFSKQG